jgi:two-component system OmpR family response regulator
MAGGLLALAKLFNRQGAMATSTIVVAREDLTIPAAPEACPAESDPAQIENHFFKTLDQYKADAVVLDLTGPNEQGVAAIRRIRQRSAVPIIVICSPEDKSMPAYREAGAAACMSPPVDLTQLQQVWQPANHRNGSALPTYEIPGEIPGGAGTLSFSGFVLQPEEQRLVGPNGAELALSAVESRVLQHLAGTPGVVWPAQAIAEAVGPGERGDADRAIGPVIARLRKKLGILAGPAGQRLIKTETGRGYMFVAEAVPAWPAASPACSA